MTKYVFLIIPILVLLSCQQVANNDNSKSRARQVELGSSAKDDPISWQKKQIIEQIIKETDSVYIIHIGIVAQAFRLERQNNTHFDKDLNLLKESLAKRIKLNIGIENGSGRILTVSLPDSDLK